jgi:hypothetical protein
VDAIQKVMEDWSIQIMDYHIPRWEELPDFDIYMDQLVTLVDRYLSPLKHQEDAIITSSMVNNYVKLKLIPKPNKKRYGRVHLAYLLAITPLKEVLSISEVKEGIEYQAQMSGLKQAFNLFCEQLEEALHTMMKQIQPTAQKDIHIEQMDYETMALRLASYAFASKLVAEKLVHVRKNQGGNVNE